MNILSSWFSKRTEQYTDNGLNPWAGLASYEDPETAAQRLKFCGRDDESYDVAKLVMGNIFVTLYGKSGIGKTSLLKAGVFPELRDELYTPLYIRLGMRDEKKPQSYQSMIVEAIEHTVGHISTINVIDEKKSPQATDFLWNYFARHRFYDKNGNKTCPVVVFDQFEEVFRGHRDEAETLLRQLDYINDKDHSLDNCTVDGEEYSYEFNFRFVVSIREDDLYRLEDSIDNCYLPALKRCRYRLRSLSEEGARAVILTPGAGLFKKEEEDSIVDSIIGKSRNEDGSISTNIVSLLCNQIFVDFQRNKDAGHIISLSTVKKFIEGNPFERFYNEATRGLPEGKKRELEKNLITEDGRRKFIDEMSFEDHLPNLHTRQSLLEGNSKILQRVPISSQGNVYGVELIHDSFCEAILNMRRRRQQQRMRLLQWILYIAIAAIVIGGSLVAWQQHETARKQKVLEEEAAKQHYSLTINLSLDKGFPKDYPWQAIVNVYAYGEDSLRPKWTDTMSCQSPAVKTYPLPDSVVRKNNMVRIEVNASDVDSLCMSRVDTISFTEGTRELDVPIRIARDPRRVFNFHGHVVFHKSPKQDFDIENACVIIGNHMTRTNENGMFSIPLQHEEVTDSTLNVTIFKNGLPHIQYEWTYLWNGTPKDLDTTTIAIQVSTPWKDSFDDIYERKIAAIDALYKKAGHENRQKDSIDNKEVKEWLREISVLGEDLTNIRRIWNTEITPQKMLGVQKFCCISCCTDGTIDVYRPVAGWYMVRNKKVYFEGWMSIFDKKKNLWRMHITGFEHLEKYQLTDFTITLSRGKRGKESTWSITGIK